MTDVAELVIISKHQSLDESHMASNLAQASDKAEREVGQFDRSVKRGEVAVGRLIRVREGSARTASAAAAPLRS